MKVMKTSELIGAALDWAAAQCVPPNTVWLGKTHMGETRIFQKTREPQDPEFLPSTDWAQGGPIIEREEIALTLGHVEAHWGAQTLDANGRQDKFVRGYGPTPLIAAMRCFVASKLGDEVELPEEL